VITPCAAKTEWARGASGRYVGGFGADAEGDRHFSDGASGVLGIEQRLCGSPYPVAMPIELKFGNPVDGFSAAVLSNPVIRLCGVEFPMVHQLAEHIDRDACILAFDRCGCVFRSDKRRPGA
jgi:hypothetical protein